MADSKYEITNQGLELLKAKIIKLEEEVVRFDKSLQRAIECFGISDEQYLDRLERKIYAEEELEQHRELLKNAIIIQHNENSEHVEIGSRVKLVNHKVCYEVEIVSPLEADPLNSKVSSESPIGSSVFGRKLGEIVNVIMPSGSVEFTIESII